MKKLLLTLAAAIGLGFMASAETYTITAEQLFNGEANNPTFASKADKTVYSGGFAFTALKNDGTNEPCYITNSKDLRIYAKATLEIKANGANITGLSFDISAQGLKRFTTVTPSVGEIAEQGVNPLVWAGSAASVTFTIGDKADFGTEGATKPGQFDFSAVTITTDKAVTDFDVPETPDTPDTPEPVANGAVYQLVILNSETPMAAGSYVLYAENNVATPLAGGYGYIQPSPVTVVDNQITTSKDNAFEFIAVDGGWNIKDSKGRLVFMKGNYNSFNVSEGIAEGEDAQGYLWTISVVDNAYAITNALTGKTIKYDTNYGSFGAYPEDHTFQKEGVLPVLYKYLKDAEGGAPEVKRTSITRLADVSKLENNELFTMDTDLTVVYANGSYNYVCDNANGYGLVYKAGLGLEAGQVITKGWNGKNKIYINLYELEPEAATLATSGTAEIPAPLTVECDQAATVLTAANQNAYVTLVGVSFAEATPAADALRDEAGNDLRNYTGTWGEATVALYQRFGVESVPAGAYDVTGFISVYKDQVQVLPIKLVANAGIEGVSADNAPVEYYNLQGVKIDAPAKGLYIRVQGKKAEKVAF